MFNFSWGQSKLYSSFNENNLVTVKFCSKRRRLEGESKRIRSMEKLEGPFPFILYQRLYVYTYSVREEHAMHHEDPWQNE